MRAVQDPVRPAAVRGPILGGMAQGTILVGTCSWTDQTLVKETDWYPRRSMSAADRLAYYAARFPIAEADSTYYYPPSPQLTRGWAERTPPGFTMNVKAYALLTGHPAKPNSLWPDVREAIKPEFVGKRNVYLSHLPPDAVEEVWARFRYALRPLTDAGKLGAVLIQYPEWFTAKKDNRAELSAIRDHWEDVPVCVEFRSPTWLKTEGDRERTLDVLRDLRLALVVTDAPPASGLPTVAEVTDSDLAVVRFHGRNNDTWKGKTETAAERFQYLYSKRQLQAWAPKLRGLAQRADRVHALMNNCYQDYGVRNAADLAELLAE
ncbi:MAG: DUF72 domain-containing protein [Acidimicrobiaceae bacterium]|nr:DUF72 domain-containing protein [Acidimicrobiaceae bacterium]